VGEARGGPDAAALHLGRGYVNDRVVWATAIGYSHLAGATPATLQTRYRIGSVSKSVTSVLLARLVDGGTVSLDDRVGAHFPDVPGSAATLEQLASHMGGVRHYTFTSAGALLREQFGRKHYADAASALPMFIDDPLEFAPGTAFAYSTHGYTLLAAMLERAGGSDFLSLLRASVTDLLGLASIGPDDVTDVRATRAQPYREIAGRFFRPTDADPSYKWAGGGLLATPSDLALLAASLMEGGLVSAEMRDALWTVRRLPDGAPNPQRYGLGWRIDEVVSEDAAAPIRVVHHGGTSPGGSAFLILVPSSRVAVAVVTNRSVENTAPLRDGARRLALLFAAADSSRGDDLGRR
jgi:serine beta-lactamase-like protein LACTB